MIGSGEFSWVGIRPDAFGIQGGIFHAHGSVQRNVRFAKPFSTVPQVLTWISGLDLRIRDGKRVDVSATNVGENGFMMNIGSSNSALIQCSVSWIAIDNGSYCAVGTYHDVAELKQNASLDGNCEFPKGKFSQPPNVLVGLSSFDLSGTNNNPRFGTKVSAVTKDGFNTNTYSWDGSSISSATVQWFAIPS